MFHPWFDNCFVVYKINVYINFFAFDSIFFFSDNHVFWLRVSVSEGVIGLQLSEIFQHQSTVKVLAWTEVIHYYIVVLLHVGSADIEARVVVGFVPNVHIVIWDTLCSAYIWSILLHIRTREKIKQLMDRKERGVH